MRPKILSCPTCTRRQTYLRLDERTERVLFL